MNSLVVDVSNEQQVLVLDHASLTPIIAEVLALEGQRCDEVALHFVTKDEICKLHARFFDDPSPTDCISLPMDESEDVFYRHLGDIFVCPEVACEYAEQNGHEPFEETLLYVVHGMLHLLGYDDLDERDRLKMREAEERHMRRLREKGLRLGV